MTKKKWPYKTGEHRKRGYIHMEVFITGLEKGNLLIQVTMYKLFACFLLLIYQQVYLKINMNIRVQNDGGIVDWSV